MRPDKGAVFRKGRGVVVQQPGAVRDLTKEALKGFKGLMTYDGVRRAF